MSRKLLGFCRQTLNYFDLSSNSSDADLLEAYKVKSVIMQSLPPLNSSFGKEFFKMQLMTITVLKNIADLYGYRTSDSPFIREVSIATVEDVSPRIITVVWLSWVTRDFSSRSFIDQ